MWTRCLVMRERLPSGKLGSLRKRKPLADPETKLPERFRKEPEGNRRESVPLEFCEEFRAF